MVISRLTRQFFQAMRRYFYIMADCYLRCLHDSVHYIQWIGALVCMLVYRHNPVFHLHPHTWTHIHTQVIHIDLIIRSKKKIQFLVSRESNTGDNGTKMRETKHLLVPFLPFSFGCHQALWGSLLVSCWHILKGKQNPILPTGRKPLTCVFPLPVCFWGFFLFLSVGIFQASSLLSRNKWGLRVCVCVSTQAKVTDE